MGNSLSESSSSVETKKPLISTEAIYDNVLLDLYHMRKHISRLGKDKTLLASIKDYIAEVEYSPELDKRLLDLIAKASSNPHDMDQMRCYGFYCYIYALYKERAYECGETGHNIYLAQFYYKKAYQSYTQFEVQMASKAEWDRLKQRRTLYHDQADLRNRLSQIDLYRSFEQQLRQSDYTSKDLEQLRYDLPELISTYVSELPMALVLYTFLEQWELHGEAQRSLR